MKTNKWDFAQAYKFVNVTTNSLHGFFGIIQIVCLQNIRSVICPNDGFILQLKTWKTLNYIYSDKKSFRKAMEKYAEEHHNIYVPIFYLHLLSYMRRFTKSFLNHCSEWKWKEYIFYMFSTILTLVHWKQFEHLLLFSAFRHAILYFFFFQ